MLNTRHNIQLSVSHLKRILRMGLKRRNLDFDIDNVIQCISNELRGSGSSMGYRAMHQKLRSVYNLQVDQETVRLCLKNLDPQGVEERSRRRLRRRVYVSKGPNQRRSGHYTTMHRFSLIFGIEFCESLKDVCRKIVVVYRDFPL
jgi:hypothetical protein